MKSFKFLIASALLLAAPGAYAAEAYTLDPMHTNVYWHANHFGFSHPSGKFADVKGTLMLDEAKPENSSLDVTIMTDSIVTGIKKFDEHLKSKDFFDAPRYPAATYKSTRVIKTGKSTAKVEGNLTLRGITKPVTLNVKLNKIGLHPMTKNRTAGFTATATIKRSDFDMKYALPDVADDVKITIETEAAIEGKK